MQDQRAFIESIIQNLDTGSLLKALGAIGIDVPQDGSVLDDVQMQDQQMESFNDLRIPLSADSGRPPMVDKNAIFALAKSGVSRQMGQGPARGAQPMAAEPTQMQGNYYGSNLG